MKKILKYICVHAIEVTYFCIAVVCLLVAVIMKSNIPILILSLLYVTSIGIDYLRFLIRKTPLYIETPDGYNEPYHPSVLFFENGWRGYRYWMAFSPYPQKAARNPYIGRWECPCVYASNDGVTFSMPNGRRKCFIDDLNEMEVNNEDYFSDPHLVYNEQNDTLEIYYRLTNRCESAPNGEILNLLKKSSMDGVNWGVRETLVRTDQKSELGKVFISPSIIRSDGEYYLWFVSSYGENRNLTYARTQNMIDFHKITQCCFMGRSCDPWHIDCHKVNNFFYMLVYEFNNELSLWRSDDGIVFYFKKVIIRASKRLGNFYHILYRSCITENHLGGYSIYFSAKNSVDISQIGIAIGNSIDEYKVINGNGEKDWLLFHKEMINKYFHTLLKLFS